MNNNFFAITIGDIEGIGIELLIKLWKNKKKIKKIDFNNCLNIFDFSAKNNFENTYYSIIYSHKLTRLNYFKGISLLILVY